MANLNEFQIAASHIKLLSEKIHTPPASENYTAEEINEKIDLMKQKYKLILHFADKAFSKQPEVEVGFSPTFAP